MARSSSRYYADFGINMSGATPKLLNFPFQPLRESHGPNSITALQREEIVMGQKWTTAHMLACRDTDGNSVRVYHQITIDDDAQPQDERFVLGNSEPIHRIDGEYVTREGLTISGPNITLP